jgi:hypothetical protein
VPLEQLRYARLPVGLIAMIDALLWYTGLFTWVAILLASVSFLVMDALERRKDSRRK